MKRYILRKKANKKVEALKNGSHARFLNDNQTSSILWISLHVQKRNQKKRKVKKLTLSSRLLGHL